jgi:hypothetical protein
MKKSVLFLFVIVFASSIFAQDFRTPRPSPDATVSQYVGVTKITIDYSCPAVKGRTIWGELVPFGKVWRTGANEVTSITFDDAVKINGNELPAGTYGIHTIPNQNEWEIIFSKDTKVDGGSGYDETKDALRIKVTPESNTFTERMTFTFSEMTENSTKVNLNWEKLKVSFNVEVETQQLTLDKARNSFKSGELMAAASYCLQNNINLDEGYKWIQASTMINENYFSTRLLAQYLAKRDQKSEAITTMEKAIEMGSKMPDPPFDFEAMKKMLEDWKK